MFVVHFLNRICFCMLPSVLKDYWMSLGSAELGQLMENCYTVIIIVKLMFHTKCHPQKTLKVEHLRKILIHIKTSMERMQGTCLHQLTYYG